MAHEQANQVLEGAGRKDEKATTINSANAKEPRPSPATNGQRSPGEGTQFTDTSARSSRGTNLARSCWLVESILPPTLLAPVVALLLLLLLLLLVFIFIIIVSVAPILSVEFYIKLGKSIWRRGRGRRFRGCAGADAWRR